MNPIEGLQPERTESDKSHRLRVPYFGCIVSEGNGTVVRLLVTIEDQPDAEGREHG